MPRTAQFYGEILNSINNSKSGYGGAQIEISNGIARIDFMLVVAQDGSDGNNYAYGINRDFLTAAVGCKITPLTGGIITFFTNNVFDGNLSGYCGLMQANGQFWTPARMHQTDGSVGGWPETSVKAGTVIIGTCFGTV